MKSLEFKGQTLTRPAHTALLTWMQESVQSGRGFCGSGLCGSGVGDLWVRVLWVRGRGSEQTVVGWLRP